MRDASQSRERPILFSGEMVRAILEDRKTQTRRVCALQDAADYAYGGAMWTPQQQIERCSYGRPGDRLWVRETWARVPASAYRNSTGVVQRPCCDDPEEAIIYRAGWDRSSSGIRWRSSIFLPRWASRITLVISSVGVQRVQSMSEEDARAEGVADRAAYAALWDKLNAKRGFSWESNPWVWIIEFRMVSNGQPR